MDINSKDNNALPDISKQDLIKRIPKVWIGYIIAFIFLVVQIIAIFWEPVYSNFLYITITIGLIAVIYWNYCVYKIHNVLKLLSDSKYPISPLSAVIGNIIPLYSLYFIFKWPNEIADYLKKNYGSTSLIPYVPGFIFLAGFLASRFVEGTVGLAVVFSGMLWITRAIKKVLR